MMCLAGCGKFRRGYDAPSRDVGHSVLLDLAQEAIGSLVGEVRAPESNQVLKARMHIRGNEMLLHNCDGQFRRDEVWRRLR
ncbi:hypothetical protein OS189_08455 [Sulfitobacter sp. F26169L]|uniref:hypothetical protein n=1 Tax=Sulfitobacter sp. F26169L TaxID=2996015 RepID=UPI002260D129|nr:hypothetical protein [Sulfitobacter sp. F26169L]MCX7566372.1 hypothetical protein [Sulfitobacter sp. F26169L]